MTDLDPWEGWVRLDDLPPLPPAEPIDERIHWRMRKSRLSGRTEVWCGASLHTLWMVGDDLAERRTTTRKDEVTCPRCISARAAAKEDSHASPGT